MLCVALTGVTTCDAPSRTEEPDLQADCTRCAGLCCVSLAFDRSALFALDKPAGVPCPHLTPDDRCGIHEELAQRGFAGCASYDCLGAGQRITQEIFGGRSWRTGGEEGPLAQAMFAAFSTMRSVHELLLLLRTAARLPLSHEQERERQALVSVLQPLARWTAESLAAFDQGPVPAKVRAYLHRLGGIVALRPSLGRVTRARARRK